MYKPIALCIIVFFFTVTAVLAQYEFGNTVKGQGVRIYKLSNKDLTQAEIFKSPLWMKDYQYFDWATAEQSKDKKWSYVPKTLFEKKNVFTLKIDEARQTRSPAGEKQGEIDLLHLPILFP